MGYFFDYTCEDKASIINGGGLVNENSDGTVSVFVNLGSDELQPIPMTKICCEAISPDYTFDIDSQTCKWSTKDCSTEMKPFKVVLNPTGNDGAIFEVDENSGETCTLDITFDYLMQFDCADIATKMNTVSTGSLSLSETSNYREIALLQQQYDDCIGRKTKFEQEITYLSTQLENTPYVITCHKPPTTIGKSTQEYTSSDSTAEGDGRAKYETLDVGFNTRPPNAFELESYSDRYYCLTDLGLQEWQTILGFNDYNTWINSNGTDTTMYNCDQVNSLITLDGNSGSLLGSCDISITARQEIISNISEVQGALAHLDCDSYLTQIQQLQPQEEPCSTVSSMFETLNVCMTLDMVNPDTGKLETVYEESIFNIGSGNLPTYLTTTQPNTGLLSTSENDTTYCETIAKTLMEELHEALPQSGTTEIQNLVENSLNSKWLNFETTITDPTILDLIYNEKIKISLYIKDCCVDFGVLIDRIKLNRDCSKVKSKDVTISKSPSFDMIRVCDNKKSWLSNEEFKHREFDLRFRDTQYDINNYKLAINSKEVDLDINPANAIEQDLFCYIKDNPCLLECPTGTTYSCPDGSTLNETGNECLSITLTASTLNGTPYSSVTGDVLAGVFDRYGAVFLGDVYDRPWPLEFSGNSGQVGVYSGTNFVVDAENVVVNAEYGGVGTGATWESPAAISNSLWGNNFGGGRMNNAGIKTSPSSVGSWVGFSHCIDVPTDGTYQVGIGADDMARFKLNGDSVFEQINPQGGSYTPYPPYSLMINHFWVFGLDLKAGKNIIEMEYLNTGGLGNLTAEIYSATTTQLAAMTTYSELSGVTIFSTGDFVGSEFQLGTTNGYSCPTDYSLDTCVPAPYQCAKIERTDLVGTDCCYQPPVSIECATDHDFATILSSQTMSCDSLVTTACTVDSIWGLSITIGCDTIYSGDFFTGTTILTPPTQVDYENGLDVAATELGLTFSATNGIGTLTYSPLCDEENLYYNKCIKVDLALDITTDCETKEFQDNIKFDFQDGDEYDFN
jgi:hypothetical protein